VLLVALWVDPDAHDENALRIANREAIRAAIADALDPGDPRALAARREDAANAFYTGD
jgi:formaldehyde-activating enzyme involved in methanogenesis